MNGIENLTQYSSGNLFSLQSDSTQPVTPDTQQFQDMLALMMFSSQFSGMQSGDESATSNLFGGNMMMPLMMNLMEQLIGLQVDNSQGAGSLLEAAALIQINQFDAEKEVGGDGINANCGPASLAMALRAVGAVSAYASEGSLVDFARRLMISDSSRDGVGQNGIRAEWEHNSYTSLDEIARGAQQAGVFANRISSDVSTIIRSLDNGSRVIVSGTFRGKDPLPWTGDTSRDYQSAPGGATEHFVLVSGYDQRTGKVIINDPARHSAIAVYPFVLERFMEGNSGALLIQG